MMIDKLNTIEDVKNYLKSINRDKCPRCLRDNQIIKSIGIDTNGDLVISMNCPKCHKYFQGVIKKEELYENKGIDKSI